MDGFDSLVGYGHALVGERIGFFPVDSEQTDSTFVLATVIGWWPQDMLPGAAQALTSSRGSRRAVFVAEDGYGERWQLSLGDAMLAMTQVERPRAQSKRGSRVLELFAGSCALSMAFWRLGVEVEMYDLRLSEQHDFRRDDALVKQLAVVEMDLVHLAPPEDLVVEPLSLERLLRSLQTIHARGCAFVMECGERSALWNTRELRQVTDLPGVEPVALDLQDFGAPKPTPTTLLANCADWLHQALTEGLSKRPNARRQPTSQPDGAEQYPRDFVDAYAEGAVRALRL